jgi:amidophosphoribosyltransferase
MCGIVALMGREPGDLETTIQMLGNVNHRGHEAVGLAATSRPQKNMRPLIPFRHFGLVRDACTEGRDTWRTFTRRVIEQEADIFLGQTRYSTVGRDDPERTQPIRANHPFWGEFALTHNGQISNHEQIRMGCEERGHTFRTNPIGDTETLVANIAQIKTKTLGEAVARVVETIVGTFSLLILTNHQLIAARDRLGNKPLWRQVSDRYVAYASEVAALPQTGIIATPVAPGSIEIVDLATGEITVEQVVEPTPRYCIFEDIYFSRPDQIHGLQTAGEFRRRLGARTARECPTDADITCYVPESGSDAGLGSAETSGNRFEPHAIVRNFFNVPSRSFILPGQKNRTSAARHKYSVSSLVRGKRVAVIDDTLVRGNTLPVITKMLFEAGATEVHVRIAAAPVVKPCYGGIDIPFTNELPAANRTEEQIRELVGSTTLKYLPLVSMLDEAHKTCNGYCAACFNGCYPYPCP